MRRNVTEHQPAETTDERPKGRIRRFEEAVHERLLAAEVAAEEAAGYGSVTAAVEAAETAVNPGHELEGDDEPPDAGPAPESGA